MKLSFIDGNYQDTAYQIIEELQKILEYEFKNKMVINNIHIKDYNTAIQTSVYYGKLNYNNHNIGNPIRITNRKIATLFILLSTHMIDRPFDVSPRTILCNV
jgi:hypothetical protein